MHNLRIPLTCFCLIVALLPCAAGAINQEPSIAQVAQKIDEYGFGSGEGRAHSADAINGHLANFAYFLREEPNSRGYMIYYRGRNKDYRRNHPFSLESQFIELTARLGIDQKRIVEVNGGCRDEPTIELWIVPEGAVAPKPTPSCNLQKRKRR